MASTKADNNRVAWTYTDDKAQGWLVSAKAVYVLDGTDGAKFGGSAAAANLRPIPRHLRMRAVKCTSAGKPDRWVPCYASNATLYANAGTTVTLNVNGVDTLYTSTTKIRGEKLPREGTRQTA